MATPEPAITSARDAWLLRLVAWLVPAPFGDAIAGALKSTDDKEKAAFYKTAQDQIMADAPWAVLTIDKLLFAATKADHITPDQHGHLQSLLRELVQGPYQLARFESIEIDCLPVAAIRASEYRQVLHEGKPLFALQGNNLAGEPVHLFPGEVPETWPEASFWQQQAGSGFAFLQLQPPRLRRGETLPHLRLDQLLEFLLGDKLQ